MAMSIIAASRALAIARALKAKKATLYTTRLPNDPRGKLLSELGTEDRTAFLKDLAAAGLRFNYLEARIDC